jgi:hypothetical protein
VATLLLTVYPDATTTVVQFGVSLQVYNGDLVVDTAAAVISAHDMADISFSKSERG